MSDRNQANPLIAFGLALAQRGYNTEAVQRRLRMAERILEAMDPDDSSGAGYRKAVERVIAELSDPAAIARCQRLAREFYPFFVDAGRSNPLARGAKPPAPAPIQVTLPPHEGLDDLVAQAQAMKLHPAEKAALAGFTRELKQAGLKRPELDRKLAIARLLLLGMRPLKPDGRHYRALIERLLSLFTRDETRSYFLGVARNFQPYLFSPSNELPQRHGTSPTRHAGLA